MRLIAILLLATLSAFAEGAAGKWKATFQGQNGTMEIVLIFQVMDDKLTGTISGPQGDMPISQGKVDGNNISFTIQRDDFKITNTAVITGDEMKIKGHMGERDWEMTAKRVE